MEISFGDRLKHAWNAFNGKITPKYNDLGVGYNYRPDRVRFTRGNERSIVTSIYNRIALDVASLNFQHVRLDENGRFVETVDSGLNNCLTLEANIDQSARALMMDVVASMFDEGHVAIVPIDTNADPNTGAFDIRTMRVGQIMNWYPYHVQVRVYNEATGQKEDIVVSKRAVAIIENPLYAVINEPNSTMQRLIRKLNLLDAVDEQSSSGKLDLIISLPYTIKTEARREQAERRKKDIVDQLSGSKYGIAYTDGTEKITQLNRPVTNNLMAQIEFLSNMLNSQLGITQSVMDGTADEKVMLNYFNRTIEPIALAIVDAMKRTFLTKTARTQRQSIAFFRDPFRLVPISDIAEIADKFTRNEIMSSNEVRQIIGLRPSADPRADELKNKNISDPAGAAQPPMMSDAENQNEELSDDSEGDSEGFTPEEAEQAISQIDDSDHQLDELLKMIDADELKHYASPYYDPVKAHEYYMRTRELKGRTSTRGLNEEGRKAARYVKDNLTAERKALTEQHSESTKAKVMAFRVRNYHQFEQQQSAMTSKIDSLRNMLKNMSTKQRKAVKDRIYGTIKGLQNENSELRQQVSKEVSAYTKGMNEGHKRISKELKEKYDEQYVHELEKIKADANFQATSKSSTSRGRDWTKYLVGGNRRNGKK